MNRKLIKTGGSLIIVIPTGILEHFDLEAGDTIDFRISGEHIIGIPGYNINREVKIPMTNEYKEI